MEQEPHLTNIEVGKIVAVMVAVMAGLVFLGVAAKAEHDDLYKSRIVHSSCYISEKTATPTKGGFVFAVSSSCGTFRTMDFVWEPIEPGKTYDLMTTKGNWAHKAFLVDSQLSEQSKEKDK
jgi:hypothetical protein